MKELTVGELFGAGDADLYDCAEKAGERCAEVSAEALMHRLKGADLILADTLGALEVVSPHVGRTRPLGLRGGGGSPIFDCRTLFNRSEQGINLRLFKNVGHKRSRSAVAAHGSTVGLSDTGLANFRVFAWRWAGLRLSAVSCWQDPSASNKARWSQ